MPTIAKFLVLKSITTFRTVVTFVHHFGCLGINISITGVLNYVTSEWGKRFGNPLCHLITFINNVTEISNNGYIDLHVKMLSQKNEFK